MGLLAQPSPATAAAKAAGEAVKALLKWRDNQSAASEKGQLFPGDDDFLYLYLTLEKIPQKSRTNPFKIPLPHPILDPSSSEFCLIIDDRRHQSKEEVKKIVKSQNLPITKVLRLSKLKSNFKPHEAKRKLCMSFDAFLVDRNIVHLLPKLLGKFFFKKKKLPLPVDLSHKNLKEQIERICGSGLLYMRTGTSCVMKVAKMEESVDEIVENVVQAIDGVVKVVPKGWNGVRSLHLKVSGSLALPIYQALPDVKLRIEGMKEIVGRSVEDRVVEVVGEEGNKEIKKKKNIKHKKKKGGRIHEVKYMDFGVVDGDYDGLLKKKESDEQLASEDDEGKGKGKAMELVVEEQGGGVREDENGGFDSSNGGKRSKRKASSSLKKSNNKEAKNTKEKEVTKEKQGKKESKKPRVSFADVAEQIGNGKKKVLNEGSRTKKTKRSQNNVA